MCAGVSSDGANTQEITGIPALFMLAKTVRRLSSQLKSNCSDSLSFSRRNQS